MTSAQTVQDSVNKYRHGVLVGNFAEEEFGRDHITREQQNNANMTTMRSSHKLENSLYRPHPVISNQDQRTQTFYGLMGAATDNHAKEPEKQTTYNIFYRQEVPRKVPIVENDCKKEERLNQEKQLFGYTKSQLENTSLRKTAGKFHYRTNNDRRHQEQNQEGGAGNQEGNANLLIDSGKALADALDHGSSRVDSQVPEEGSKIGPIRAQSLNNQKMHDLMAKAEAVNLMKKKSKQPQDHLKVGDKEEGQQRHILFGHGLTVDNFHHREFVTTYDLSFNQKVKPQTQINSFFKPDMTQTAKEFHRDTLYEKNHQVKIPEFNNRNQLYNDKMYRPYAPYTKTYDQKHMKHEYLRR